jgi:hypothetical protein
MPPQPDGSVTSLKGSLKMILLVPSQKPFAEGVVVPADCMISDAVGTLVHAAKAALTRSGWR